MEDEVNKIEAALLALMDDNSVEFDEIVADIMQDKVSAAVEAKREEFKKVAFATPADEVEETDEVEAE